MSDFEYMSIKAEADRIQRLYLREGEASARRSLRALLDRPNRLPGAEKTLALDFNARLVTELRERKVKLFRELAVGD